METDSSCPYTCPSACSGSTLSESTIQGTLENLIRGRTSIVVAHRLSTVAALDRIVVLEDGAIVEDGTHAELSRAGGTYESLWDRQTGAFLEAE